ncbi:biotin/lipoyl-binding protein [Ruminiclostridium herbifermentans]|uniref:Biotin/lipoyl-binding protein n=1 Tax=Ruminiclostridium herbifermentans TaxID=2488810 RepID=A0A4U7JHC9_9FIRM|nr:biotin/lipoyl-binding protein [Ruminiclostridium herbifermentans]QNU67343.1 biotin/lipoyl-binding protein [Ruminiclostridium herbifermentans]
MEAIQTEAQTYKKKKLVRNAAIIFITVVVLLTFFSKTINNFLLPEIEITSPRAGTLTKEITAQGEVVPLNTETINAYGNWKITDVKVKEGTEVKKGEILATIDVSDMKLEIKKMELNLLKMENSLKLYQNGTQAIDLEQYRDEVQLAQNEVDKAQKKLEEQKKLFSLDAVALESVNDAEEQLDKAKREYEQKQKLLKQKEDEIKKNGEDYQTIIKEKQAELELCRIELETIKKNSPQGGTIKSPVDGLIKSLSIEKGSVANSGQTLFEIIKRETDTYIKWTLDSKRAGEVDKRAEVMFSIAEPEKLEFSGAIKEKKYLLNEGTYQYLAEVKKEGLNLEIGQKVDVLVKKSSTPYPKLVPNSSITKEIGKSCVYVMKTKNGIMGEERYVQKVEVTVDESDNFYSAISGGGLTEDDKVVTFSSKPLSDKIQVKLR